MVSFNHFKFALGTAKIKKKKIVFNDISERKVILKTVCETYLQLNKSNQLYDRL